MPQTVQFSGIIPPVSTIFTADGQFDKPGTAALIDDMIAAGVDGLFFLGSGGSSRSSTPASAKPLPPSPSPTSTAGCRC
jgi:dihydrodipicolinate synthase/N-acetylneuraminate lyase